MRKEGVALTLLSNGPYWLFTSLSMTHTLSYLVSSQSSRKIAEKTQPRGKSGQIFELHPQPFLLDFCAAFFVDFFMWSATFLPCGFLKMSNFTSFWNQVIWTSLRPSKNGFCEPHKWGPNLDSRWEIRLLTSLINSKWLDSFFMAI